MKRRTQIDPLDVHRIFSDEKIRELAAKAKKPQHFDLTIFATTVRWYARNYAEDVRAATRMEMFAEIKALYRAAEKRQYQSVAELLEGLSPETFDHLNKFPCASLPSPAALRNPAQRQNACAQIGGLCARGGSWVGRRRANGKHSRITLLVDFNVPPIRRSKRAAEQMFIMGLQIAWSRAARQDPPWTARNDQPGPFARMAQEALALVGAPHANAVENINNLNRSRREKRKLPLSSVKT